MTDRPCTTRCKRPNPRDRGRLVPVAVEAYGRLGKEGLRFLRKAAGRACTRTTALAVLGGEGPPAVLGSWLERQSVALQKNNAAAFKAAAGAAATWRDLRAPGLEEAALEVLAEADVDVLRPNLVGDTTYVTAAVTDRWFDGNAFIAVEIEGRNQHRALTTKGRGLIALPSSQYGPVHLPLFGGDPERWTAPPSPQVT